MDNGSDDRALCRGCIGIRFHSYYQLVYFGVQGLFVFCDDSGLSVFVIFTLLLLWFRAGVWWSQAYVIVFEVHGRGRSAGLLLFVTEGLTCEVYFRSLHRSPTTMTVRSKRGF